MAILNRDNWKIRVATNYFNSGVDWKNSKVWDEGYTYAEAKEHVEYLNERNAGSYCYKVSST